MSWTAFYAPMKPPDHPVPSGDRAMARALMTALSSEVRAPLRLASTLRTREGAGDAAAQSALLARAAAEVTRLCAGPPPERWVTYHNYYKAPDLLGPAVARHFDIPYAIIEPSRARKRLSGPWADFAARAEAASDAAGTLFAMTTHDRAALLRDRAGAQDIILLRPFLAREALPDPSPGGAAPLAVAMMRAGDKLASYAALAEALPPGCTLDIVGDGPARGAVEALFGARARFHGTLSGAALGRAYARAGLFVWPGIGEAYGMVYLEAQAYGLPALAEDRPGVRDVIREGGVLVEQGGLKPALGALLNAPERRAALARAGREQIAREHLLPAARATLRRGLGL